ncbi:MAG: UDP-N-acetylmuramoyl-L-alanine--D-glutamate ligase [Desulfobacterales bacterium]|nr:UDP-N-acetylmuramoyl-L-alanine--D-glutamate ligase [Desulfobacterales bacterium]
MMELENKNTVVVGLGKSGIASARFLKQQGARVTATDITGKRNLPDAISDLEGMGISLELGMHSQGTFDNADLIVLSPGVPHTITPVIVAGSKGIPVIGEIELASLFIKEPIVAITGTNGKTTTTTLIGEMLKASGKKVFVGGNIGSPLIDYVAEGGGADVVVAEISSFQMDTADKFKPAVGVLLNISEDHLDRYKNMQDYARSKGRLFMNQDDSDIAVLNGSDRFVRSVSKNFVSKKLYYGRLLNSDKGAVLENNDLTFNTENFKNISFDLSKSKLKGQHNRENIAAGCLAALGAGATPEGIRNTLNSFKGLPHRVQYVETVNGVEFYDDSKATNIDAVIRALEGFDAPVILIMGGRDKGGNYRCMASMIKSKVKKLIIMGEATNKIKEAVGNKVPSQAVKSMSEAVDMATGYSDPGDIVLLSPACSSFDMYNNYSERGDDFSKEVKRLKHYG